MWKNDPEVGDGKPPGHDLVETGGVGRSTRGEKKKNGGGKKEERKKKKLEAEVEAQKA